MQIEVNGKNCPYCGGTDLVLDRSDVWVCDEKWTSKLEVGCENYGKDFEALFAFVYFFDDERERIENDVIDLGSKVEMWK